MPLCKWRSIKIKMCNSFNIFQFEIIITLPELDIAGNVEMCKIQQFEQVCVFVQIRNVEMCKNNNSKSSLPCLGWTMEWNHHCHHSCVYSWLSSVGHLSPYISIFVKLLEQLLSRQAKKTEKDKFNIEKSIHIILKLFLMVQ